MKSRRLLCALLAVVFLLGVLPLTANAGPVTVTRIDEFRFAGDYEAIALRSNKTIGAWMSNLKAKGGVKAAADAEGWKVVELVGVYDWQASRYLKDNEYPNLYHSNYLRIRVALLSDDYIFQPKGSSYPTYYNGRQVSSDVLNVYYEIDLYLSNVAWFESVSVTVPKPVAGGKPSSYVPKVSTPHVKIDSYEWLYTGPNNDSPGNSFSTFQNGGYYRLMIYLVEDDGYVIANNNDLCKMTVNGSRESYYQSGKFTIVTPTFYIGSAVIYGDLDSDKKVTTSDALICLKAAVGITTLNSTLKKAANVNGDSKVSTEDALLILKRAVGIIKKFPVE